MIPSRRLALAFGLASVWLFLAPVLPQAALFAVGHNLLLISFVVADFLLLKQVHCSLRRICSPSLSLGAANPVRVEVWNNGSLRCTVLVRDEPPHEFAAEGARFACTLHPGQVYSAVYRVTPPSRGDFSFGNLNARLATSLGMFIRQERTEARWPVRVLPDVLQTRKYELLARRNRLTAMGLRPSGIKGAGLEFESLRDYMPDDELRRVDWKATARKGRLISKEYQLERSQNVMLVLDAGRTMASRLGLMSKLDYAVNAAILLSFVAARSDDRVGLLVFADEVLTYLPPGKGKTQGSRIVDAVYPLQPRIAESDYRTAFAFLKSSAKRRSLIIIFTDLLDPDSSRRLLESVSYLRPLHLVVCVALSDYELTHLVGDRPDSVSDIYRQTVALSVLKDRRQALDMLSSQGVLAIGAAPKHLSAAVVNRYLSIKEAAMI